MGIQFQVSDVIPASPEKVYKAWLDSKEHEHMTGAYAHITAKVGVSFEAWDGYIQGINLELEPPRRILQSWRTTEFDEKDESSILEILF